MKLFITVVQKVYQNNSILTICFLTCMLNYFKHLEDNSLEWFLFFVSLCFFGTFHNLSSRIIVSDP